MYTYTHIHVHSTGLLGTFSSFSFLFLSFSFCLFRFLFFFEHQEEEEQTQTFWASQPAKGNLTTTNIPTHHIPISFYTCTHIAFLSFSIFDFVVS